MARLYLHVGTHKTATTSLQAWLYDQRRNLRARGVHVATERHRRTGETATCLGFAHGILRNDLRTVARMVGDMPASSSLRGLYHRGRIRGFLKRLPVGAHAVVSAEALSFARTGEEAARLAGVFEGLDVEIVPVVCFRNEADWRRSWEAELRAWEAQMAQGFGSGLGDIRGEWYFDRAAVEDFWSRFGDLRAVEYDDARAGDGSVLPALLEAMDIPREGGPEPYFLRQSRG